MKIMLFTMNYEKVSFSCDSTPRGGGGGGGGGRRLRQGARSVAPPAFWQDSWSNAYFLEKNTWQIPYINWNFQKFSGGFAPRTPKV